MTTARTDFREYIRAALVECGASDIAFEERKNHPRVRWMIGDEDFSYVLPFTPSDYRARLNCRADLRRMCRAVQPQETEMEHMNGTEVATVQPKVVVTDETLSLYRVSDVEEEPRVRDVDLAAQLGMRQARDVRRLIRTHWKKLNEINSVVECAQVHPGNGCEFTEYFLDRKQALFIAARSKTPQSDNVVVHLADVYDRWRKGTLPMHPSATANLATDAQLAILTQIRDVIVQTNESISNLKGDQSAMLDTVAGLESRLHAVDLREAAPALPAPTATVTGHMTLSAWCQVRGIAYRDTYHLGRAAGTKLARIARVQGRPEQRVNGTGSRIYSTDWLDGYADDIREWLA